jgi:hypothetical protein
VKTRLGCSYAVCGIDWILGVVMISGALAAFQRDAISLAWLFSGVALLLFQVGSRLLQLAALKSSLNRIDEELSEVRRRLAIHEAPRQAPQ